MALPSALKRSREALAHRAWSRGATVIDVAARWWGPGVIALAGGGLGFWMFGPRGAALFGTVAVLAVVVFLVIARHVPGVGATVVLVLAAGALYAASTLGWGGADAPDGTRYKVSPVGLSHVLTPHQSVSETVDCGWYAASGYAARCTVPEGRQGAFRRLLAVYPLVLSSTALCMVGALMSFRRHRRLQGARRLVAGGAAAVTLMAVVLFAGSIQEALSPLAGLSVGVGGTLGTMEVTAAILLCLTACLSPRQRRVFPSGA